MFTLELILSQIAISLLVVALYHLWVSGPKQAAPLDSAPPTPALPPITTPVATSPKAVPAADQVSPETLAVIAAAITVVLGGPHRLVSVQQAAARAPEINVWALEGRMEQFKSHKVR